MGWNLFDVEYSEFVLGGETFDCYERKIREVLVIDRIKLVLINKPLEVRKFERDHTVARNQMRHSSGEVIEIRHLRQNIIADDEIGAPSFGRQPLRKFQAEEFDKRWDILLPGRSSDVCGRLNSKYRDAQRQEVLEQVSIVAGDLAYLTLRTETKSLCDHLAIPASMIHP